MNDVKAAALVIRELSTLRHFTESIVDAAVAHVFHQHRIELPHPFVDQLNVKNLVLCGLRACEHFKHNA